MYLAKGGLSYREHTTASVLARRRARAKINGDPPTFHAKILVLLKVFGIRPGAQSAFWGSCPVDFKGDSLSQTKAASRKMKSVEQEPRNALQNEIQLGSEARSDLGR